MRSLEFDEKRSHSNLKKHGIDLTTAKRPNQAQKRINVDIPVWMIDSLDKEASRVGVTRQSIIKVWLAERLEEIAAAKALQRTNR